MAQGGAQWELSKENILPMKTGRDVAVLNAALGDESSKWKEDRLREWRSFQDRLVAAENDKEELLNAYYDLLCWLENTFPQGGRKYIKLNAKRCFHKLKDDKSFHDNWKFMKVMVKYIEASGESCRYISENSYCDLYNYMYINRIGTKHADFFISWANALEASESYPQAATVFSKGLQMGAEPRKVLEKEKTLFEDRMALRAIEDMMKDEGKLPTTDRRQPLNAQGLSVPKVPAVPDEEATVRMRKTTSDIATMKSEQCQKPTERFSVHSGETNKRPGQVSAFTAASAPSATNVVPTRHNPDKENSQKAEQWAKPSTIPPKPSLTASKAKPKAAAGTAFEIYCDEPEQSADQNSSHNKAPICLGQTALKIRKDDEIDDDLLKESNATKSSSSAPAKIKSGNEDENTKFMFCEDAIMNGPLGEISFEELRANHVLSLEKKKKVVEQLPSSQTCTALAAKVPLALRPSMGGLLDKDEDDEDHNFVGGHGHEADLTMALNVEVSRRGLSQNDRQILGKTAFADSMMHGADDSWSATTFNQPNPNQTVESVRLTHDTSEAPDTSVLLGTSQVNETNKLSMTQFDCLNRILSQAFRGPSQAGQIPPPFGLSSADDTVSSEANESVGPARSLPGSRLQHRSAASDFVAFEDSMVQPLAPKADFFAYEDSFAVESSNKNQLSSKKIALNPREEEASFKANFAEPAPDFVLYDSFASSAAPAPAPQAGAVKKFGLRPQEEPRSFAMYEDEAADAFKQQQGSKRTALAPRSDDSASASAFVIVNDDSSEASSNAPQNVSESPVQKRSKPSRFSTGPMFSEGLADCSGIVADFPICEGDGGLGGGGRFSLSTTIEFNPNKPKFCSTQYVDCNMLNPATSTGEDAVQPNKQNQFQMNDEDDEPQLFAPNRPPVSGSNMIPPGKRPGGLKRQSITSRISTMPPLQERSESSSSGGSTMAMHSALHTVRESGLSAIWESNNNQTEHAAAAAAPIDENEEENLSSESTVALPTMNCELQKSYHHIDVEKYVAYSQLQQSVAFQDKTYSCLREIDPTDPFSDELVERFVRKYEPALKKLSTYVEVPNVRTPDFFSGNARQSCVGKVVQLAPNFSMTYAFRVGSGAFASVVAAREVETRKLYALKFQTPACKWEFYVVHELRERLKRKFASLHSVLDGVMDIERAFIYKDGSCYAMQHVRYGPLLNLVNKAREHRLDLSEAVAMYLTIELLRLFECVHACHIIHADLKPDNVLFLGLPELPKLTRNSMTGQQCMFPPKEASIRLIDFGRSIDMTMFPAGTAFLAKVATSGFDCIEMRTDRPWTYQADYFGLAGTVHVLVFLEYMRVSWRDDSRSEGRWWISRKSKRIYHHNDLWERLFDELLNIPDCDHQPDIKSLREAFETRFVEKMLTPYTLNQSAIMTTMKESFHSN